MALVIPGQVAMLPLFLMLKGLGLVNTWMGVLVPGMAGIFGIFLVRRYALNVPQDLLEAARIDGAGRVAHLRQRRAAAAHAGAGHAGAVRLPGQLERLHVAAHHADRRRPAHPPVALAALSREHVRDSEFMMAGAVITVLPVLLLFIALQRFFYLQGLMLGGVK